MKTGLPVGAQAAKVGPASRRPGPAAPITTGRGCARGASRSALDFQVALYPFRGVSCLAALLRLASEAQSRSIQVCGNVTHGTAAAKNSNQFKPIQTNSNQKS